MESPGDLRSSFRTTDPPPSHLDWRLNLFFKRFFLPENSRLSFRIEPYRHVSQRLFSIIVKNLLTLIYLSEIKCRAHFPV